MYNFKMTRPSTIGEAVEALKQEDAQALGGGQTLIPTLKQRLAMPSILVSLTSILEMEGVYMPPFHVKLKLIPAWRHWQRILVTLRCAIVVPSVVV
jgi:CO/xanthine dehydrogenase FAD-binding subunit